MTDVAEYFCQTHNVNIARQSCGDVRVQSYSYYKGEDRGNRFLVSYEVIGYDVKGPSFAPYILPCGSTGSGLIASSKEIKDGGYLTSDDGKSGNGTVMEYPLNPRKFSFIYLNRHDQFPSVCPCLYSGDIHLPRVLQNTAD